MGSSCSSVPAGNQQDMQNAHMSVHSTLGQRIKSSIFNDSSSSCSSGSISDQYSSHTNHTPSIHPEPSEVEEEEVCEDETADKIVVQDPVRRNAADIKLPVIPDISPKFQQLLGGRVHHKVGLNQRIINIYHCAVFSDSVAERDSIHTIVYPRLQEYCAGFGYEVNVIDLCQGLRDEFVFSHSLTKLREHLLADQIQADPYTIITVFLNEKYGTYWCPLTIEQDLMDNNLLKKMTEGDRGFLLKWYKLSEHRVPAVYELQPVESCIPKYANCTTAEAYRESRRAWEKECIRIRNVLCQPSVAEYMKEYLNSNIEREVGNFLCSDKCNRDNVIWLKRSFKDLYVDQSADNPLISDYRDMIGDRPNENIQKRLKNLCKGFDEQLDARNKVGLAVSWSPEGLTTHTKEHLQYFEDLTEKYYNLLKEAVDQIMEKKGEEEKKVARIIHKGITRSLHTDLIENSKFCRKLCADFVGQCETISVLENYITHGQHDGSNSPAHNVYPLLLHGEPGCGKSALAAVLANNCSQLEGWSKSVCVLRFHGASVECDSIEQLLCSIGEQICVLTQQPKHMIHKDCGSILHSIFDVSHPLVPPTMPLLLIIDGVDQFVPGHTRLIDVHWLPRLLPRHVRIVLTVTSEAEKYRQIKEHLGENVNIVQVPPFCLVYSTLMLGQKLESHHLALTTDQQVHCFDLINENGTPLYIAVLFTIIRHRAFTSTSTELHIGLDIQDLLRCYFEMLESYLGKRVTDRLLSYVTCSRQGLSDAEINDVMSCDETVMQELFSFADPKVQRLPSFVWIRLKNELGLLLRERTVNGVRVYSWRHELIGKVVKKMYVTAEGAHEETHQSLLDYFEGKWANKKSISTVKNGKKAAKVRLVQSQNLRTGEHLNRRRLDEVPYHLYCLKKGQLLLQMQLQLQWLTSKLEASNVLQTLTDLRHGLELTSNGEQLEFVFNVLTNLLPVLHVDGRQFLMHFCTRVNVDPSVIKSEHSLVTVLYEQAQNQLSKQLIPHDNFIKPLLAPEDKADCDSLKNTMTMMFSIPTDHEHMITLSPDSGTLRVWNIYTRECLRTLTGLSQPRNLKMCEGTTAIVLCNRELHTYNLDKGCLESKLKGVLNLKMPYFGVHDKRHTMALSRNRMYVNMINNQTGDIVTTFKVGEDRFLNSLLVSDNGEICVCGDEVQKPFPLLVWDLTKRKLIYDLRIQGHEFVTKMSAITKDGHYVVCVCKELEDPDPNFLIVYDLQSGSMFKKWKPDYSTTAVAISQTARVVISAQENGDVLIWDLVGGSLKYTLFGHFCGPSTICVSDNGKCAVTFNTNGRDTTVWMWDVMKGESMGWYCPDRGVSCCAISWDGRFVVLSLPGLTELITLIPEGGSVPQALGGVYGDASRIGMRYDVTNKP